MNDANNIYRFFFKVSFALLLLFLERYAKFSPAGVAILQFVGDLLSCGRLSKIEPTDLHV